MAYWLLKSEPDVYSFSRLEKEGRTMWEGVRNYQARNNMRAMQPGDLAFFYHSNIGKEIVGVCRIDSEAYADPTADKGDWSVVDVVPVKPLQVPVSLKTIKSDPALADMALVKNSRLSVSPVTEEEFFNILRLGATHI